MTQPNITREIEKFKEFHGVPKNKSFTLNFGLENDKLRVKFDDDWVPLTRKNGSFYMKSSLKRTHKAKFMNALFKNTRDTEQNDDNLMSFSDDAVPLLPLPPEKEYILDEPIAETYTVVLNITMRPGNSEYVEQMRQPLTLTPAEAEHYRSHLQEPAEYGNPVVEELFTKMDMLAWLENRGSAEPSIAIESITPSVEPFSFDWASRGVAQGEKPFIYTKWSNCSQLWESPDFRPNRCMLSAFLGKFKHILEGRRIYTHPDLNYEGLWKLARPTESMPADDEP